MEATDRTINKIVRTAEAFEGAQPLTPPDETRNGTGGEDVAEGEEQTGVGDGASEGRE
jgi:hypothetical protein